jgi:2-polyprenyl-6-methoxyphenol hydroxylase-like FAD-dependent oxidoreductase
VGLDGSRAILESGETIAADVVVGADGLHSVIREALHGKEAPRRAGYTCFRGISSDDGVLPERSALLAVGAGSQFGLWPCGAGRLYWFLTRNLARGGSTKAEAIALCRHWAKPVPEVVQGTPEELILHNEIVDRSPLGWWGRGPVTLLGDAAHACTPNLGQGACQALEDAVVLAHSLAGAGAPEDGLRRYEALRISRTAAVVRESWRAGRALQLDSPVLERLRNSFMGTGLGARLQAETLRGLLVHRLPRLEPKAGRSGGST